VEKEKFNIFDKNFVYEVQLPTGGTRKIDRDELDRLTLNPANSIPDMNGNKTWINNYVGTFWSHFMGPVPFAIYFQILKMAYGDKDYAFPTVPYIAMLIGASHRTVQRHMKKLIELNFVVVVQVKDGRTNESQVNLYMLSSTTPFISKSQYDQLPKRLKEEHDSFIEKIKKRKLMLDDYIPKYKGPTA
jgi:hypothetical protein